MMKISIKREQSQAGLSFAERENRRSLAGGESNFRPQVKNKLLLLLALLLTAATGAWATDVYVVGNGTGNWLNGVAWDPGAAGNKMTEQNGVYSITFNDVDANSDLQFKFAINGTWAETYGCTSGDANELNKTLSNIEAGGANFKFGLTEKADVTISFNLSELTYMISTKGMKVGDDAATGYTVSLKDGVKDADKWTVKVGEGQAQALPIGGLTGDGSETVTLQYTGRLKVKGVKATSEAAAPAAKEPATVTTAPTGAAIVGVGKTTALVSGGAAEGGELMYKVTDENTKPASTDGFSADVPTAQSITASGTVYVWYYVKADDTHSDSEIAATAIEVPVADIVWDTTNVFNSSHKNDKLNSNKKTPLVYEGISISMSGEEGSTFAAYDHMSQTGLLICYGDEGDSFTFTAPSGMKFCKIEIIINESFGFDDYGDWTGDETGKKFVWSGTAANAVTLGTVYTPANNLNSIAFYLSE